MKNNYKKNNTHLSSNYSFGLFFSIIFIILGIYFFYLNLINYSYMIFGTSFIFAIITIFKSSLLGPLNNLWIKLGLIIGYILTPIILGVFFFAIFTPVSIFTRMFGRDELSLKYKKNDSLWKVYKDVEGKSFSFLNQF